MIIKNISGLIFYTQPQPVCKPISNELFTLIGNHSYTGLFKNKQDKSFYFFKITIPNGYKWDKRTIPKIFRCLRSKDGLVELSALIHDFLYETKGGKNIIFGELKFYHLELLKKTRLFNVYFSRKVCDQIYREIYKVMDKKNNTANQDYFWLRLFGRFYWGRKVL